MTMSRISAAIAFGLGALTLLGSSCTVIFAPRDDVQRCGTADECDPTGDNRYVPVCKFDDANLDLDSSQVDKVCVADFRPNVGCNPESYLDPAHPYAAALSDFAVTTRYSSCDENSQGSMGCPPVNGACNDGLVENDQGYCDDTDPNTPTAYRADSEEFIGQDVRDQFCRSYFCDDRFVCDSGTNFCVLCQEDEILGEGGCGEIYIGGARSCIYDVDLGATCQGADSSDSLTTFGTCA